MNKKEKLKGSILLLYISICIMFALTVRSFLVFRNQYEPLIPNAPEFQKIMTIGTIQYAILMLLLVVVFGLIRRRKPQTVKYINICLLSFALTRTIAAFLLNSTSQASFGLNIVDLSNLALIYAVCGALALFFASSKSVTAFYSGDAIPESTN